MAKVALTNMQGAAVGEIELSDNTFGVQVNESAMHLVVRAQLNAQRQGTQSAKTRTEVRGGGRKIYRQKGTGNARHHSNRAPQFKHGGVVFAPKPRDYSICVPRKVRRLAMKSALTLAEGKTKLMAEVMKNLGSPRKALVVTPGRDENVVRASNNLAGVKTASVGTINVLDILNYDKFIITQEAVKLVEEVYQ